MFHGFFSFGEVFINKHSDRLPNNNIRHYTKKNIHDIFKISLSKISKEVFSY
jgi:hypothetical protein